MHRALRSHRISQAWFLLFLGLALAGIARPIPSRAADDYPVRPIKIVTGAGPGSVADVAIRALSVKLYPMLGQTFVIEPRPGAGTIISATYVARSANDGYTLLLGGSSLTINSSFAPGRMSFNLERDLTPVVKVVSVPLVLVVHPSLGVANVAELVALAKSKPGEVMFGSGGEGTAPYVSGELFNHLAGVKLTHVPYAGTAQAAVDLLAGRIGVAFSPPSTVMQLVASGGLKALAVTSRTRSALAPQLPTLAESGLAGFETTLWLGLLGPADFPKPASDRLVGAFTEAMKSPDYANDFQKLGFDVDFMGPADFKRYLETETKQWANVVATTSRK